MERLQEAVAEVAPGHSCLRKIPLTSQPSRTRLPSARMSGERSASEPLGMQVSARYLFRQRRCSLERFSALQASLQTVTTCRPRVYLSMRCGNHTCSTQPATFSASHTSTEPPFKLLKTTVERSWYRCAGWSAKHRIQDQRNVLYRQARRLVQNEGGSIGPDHSQPWRHGGQCSASHDAPIIR